MTKEKALQIIEEAARVDLMLGKREEIRELANRLRATVPMLKEIKHPNNVIAAAQYIQRTGVNPFRGEFYFYEEDDSKPLVLVGQEDGED